MAIPVTYIVEILQRYGIIDTPGTAALLNVPAAAGAAATATEVVRGDDPRLAAVGGAGLGPTYVFRGNYADRPAAAGYGNGSRATILDLVPDGGVCEFEVRTILGTKYWVPVGEIALAFAGSAITGVSGTAASLATPLYSQVGTAAGVFVTLVDLIRPGMLSAPGIRLRVEGYGKKSGGTGTAAAFIAALGAIDTGRIGGAFTATGDNQDARICADLFTTPGMALGSGIAPVNGAASQQAAPVTVAAGAQSLLLGYSDSAAAHTKALYFYRVTLSA